MKLKSILVAILYTYVHIYIYNIIIYIQVRHTLHYEVQVLHMYCMELIQCIHAQYVTTILHGQCP